MSERTSSLGVAGRLPVDSARSPPLCACLQRVFKTALCVSVPFVHRFLVADPQRLGANAVDLAYVAGLEGIPWRSRNTLNDGVLTLRREIDDTGAVFIPWRVDGGGQVALCTASLMTRDEPYHLAIELARGTLNRFRNQRATWESLGLHTGPHTRDSADAAVHAFVAALAAVKQPDGAERASQEAIRHAVAALSHLAENYSQQAIRLRHDQATRLGTLWGAQLDDATLNRKLYAALAPAVNTVALSPRWMAVERDAGRCDWTVPDQQARWAAGHKLRPCVGPIIHLDRRGTPDWLYLWEEDFEAVQSYVEQYTLQVVNRYRGQVVLWHVAAGLNTDDALSLGEEERLRLCVAAIDVARRADPQTPLVVSFDQPWAEYLGRQALDLSPLHYADALIRAEVGLSAIGLEINLGHNAGCTLPRDPVELSQQIDRWSLLGLPLIVYLSAENNGPLVELVEQYLHILLAKQAVRGVFWRRLQDDPQASHAHAGLFTAAGAAKPWLKTLREMRQKHLH